MDKKVGRCRSSGAVSCLVKTHPKGYFRVRVPSASHWHKRNSDCLLSSRLSKHYEIREVSLEVLQYRTIISSGNFSAKLEPWRRNFNALKSVKLSVSLRFWSRTFEPLERDLVLKKFSFVSGSNCFAFEEL